jgi:hypothetical protein
MVASKTQPVGYLFGGTDAGTNSQSQKIYSFTANFSTVTSLSSCSTTNFGAEGVESSTSCPTPRVANAIWLIEEQYVYIFGGDLLTYSGSLMYV